MKILSTRTSPKITLVLISHIECILPPFKYNNDIGNESLNNRSTFVRFGGKFRRKTGDSHKKTAKTLIK